MTQALRSDDIQRLRAVEELGTPGQTSLAALQSITRLLLRGTRWPVAFISLVDATHERLLTKAGIEATSIPAGLSFAAQTIAAAAQGHAGLEVADVQADPRWAANALAQEAPHLRSVHCRPLRVVGSVVGALGVGHTEVGTLDIDAGGALEDLALSAAALLEAQLQEHRTRRLEARVRGASRASIDWLWESDAEGVITWVSNSVEDHTGESPASLIGRMGVSYHRALPGEHAASFEAYLKARRQRLAFRDVIAERITPRGTLIVSISGNPVRASDGRFMGYRGASRDVTDVISLQYRAHRAEMLLRGSIEHSNAAIMISDPGGEIIVHNGAWRRKIEAFVPDPPTRLPALVEALIAAGAYPDAIGREADFKSWRLSLAEPDASVHELRFGDTVQLVSAQRLADGCVVHLSIDITEHHQAQQALREQQQRLRTVLEALPDRWFVLDSAGQFLEGSDDSLPSLQDPFGRTHGRGLVDVLPAEVAAATLSALSTALRVQQVQRIEYELTIEGATRQFEARFAPMGGDRVLQLVRELTDLRALERDVHLMQRAFEAPGSLPMSVCDASRPDLPLIYVNAAFETLAGLPRSELLGRSCRLLQGSDRDQPGLDQLRQALKKGTSCVVQLRNYRADGLQFINELHIAPVHDGNGRLTHFVGVQHDVTERTRSENQLRVREALYRSVTAAISDGLLVISARGTILTANPAACRLLNVPQDTLLGRNTRQLGFQLLHDDGRAVTLADDPAAEVLRGGPNIVNRVLRLRRPDGIERVLDASFHRLVTGSNDDEVACVVAFTDITEQRAAEIGMAQAEGRWRFALEEAGDGLIDYSEDTGRTFFSPRWKAMLGYTHHEIGQSLQEWSHRIHPEDYDRVMRTMRRYRAGELPEYRSEHRLRHKNGHWVWVLDRAKIVERHPDGRPRRVVGIYTDITRMKAADSALRDKRAAELASASKSEFLSRMSHEMRTPLNAVIGFAQLLQMRGDAGRPVPVAKYSEHIVQSGRHLLSLVNDVLDLQQVETGRMTLSPESVGLQDVLEAARRLVEPAAIERRVEVTIAVDPQLRVWADPRRLKQVLLNLMANGVKYNQFGGSLRCEVESITTEPGEAPRAVLIIEDTGEGLTPEQMARLFQPFERLGRETSAVEGSGLGLVISRALVREMNGSLTMSSQVGTGSRVRVELPLAYAPDSQHAPVAALESPTPAPAPEVRPLRMLYVEDNRLNALLFEEAIKMRGNVDLRIVEDGPDAFELVKAWQPDVFVLDAHLPSMSGYEVLTRLRQLPQFLRTPAFMCSADALPDEVQRAREAGFAGYWSKPIDISQVMKELDVLPAAQALSRR